MRNLNSLLLFALLVSTGAVAAAQQAPESGAVETPAADAVPAGYDEQLARGLGADEYGMRSYVLVILKTGPTPVPKGAERDAMFRGHFENMNRLEAEGKLALAGPLDGVDGWRGLFVLAVDDLAAARDLVATDPVIQNGEMVAEYHEYYGSAALMTVAATHAKIARKNP